MKPYRKTCFILIYNLLKMIAILLLISLSITFLLFFQIQHGKIISGVTPLFTSLIAWCLFLIFLLLALLLSEFYLRLKNDRLRNSLKSFWATFRLHHFLIQHDKYNQGNKEGMVNRKDLVLHSFNRAARKAVLDLRENQLLLCLKLPKELQAQALFKAQEEAIREHISNLYPHYILSPFERQKFNLWLKGTKEK